MRQPSALAGPAPAGLPRVPVETIQRADAAPHPEPLLYTVEQCAHLLQLSRTRIYGMLARGELESLKLTGVRRIPRAAIETWLQQQREAAAAEAR
jgi:excisionase family DNA binding protein